VVTPSFNHAPFIEQTIRSVLHQAYPDVEYLVIDGGSQDGSVDVIRGYAPRLTHWESQANGGQGDAINRGMLKSTGEILGAISSDDTYEPGAFMLVGTYFRDHPEVDVVYGSLNIVDAEGRLIRPLHDVPFSRRLLVHGALNVGFPAVFIRRQAFFEAGTLRPEFFFAMDYDLLLRLCLRDARFAYLGRPVANFRVHPASKTSTHWPVAVSEVSRIRQDLFRYDDHSVFFRLQHGVCRAQRAIHLLRQGEGAYVWRGVRARLMPRSLELRARHPARASRTNAP